MDRAVQAEWNRDSARMELEQLKQRVAELEAQLGIRKARGLAFKVSCTHDTVLQICDHKDMCLIL